MRQWASILARLLTTADPRYRISTMYLEFVNVASPGDTSPNPNYDRNPASAASYYAGLALSSDRDFMRVPLIAKIEATDQNLYPEGNLITWFAQTQGTAGVNGKPFGDVHNSLVVGGALVAMLDQDNPAQDLIMSRFYYVEAEQVPKQAVGQVGVEWESELQ
jgi:hypothetical protein